MSFDHVELRPTLLVQATPAGVPTVVLLHGFPASSFMFRDLIPVLADRYHVIAPDHLGFGLSGAPPAGEFTYTWHHDFVLVYRPGSGAVQLRLFADHASNLPLYPKLHAWLGGSGCRCWRCGAATMRSSGPRRWRSRRMRPVPSTWWTGPFPARKRPDTVAGYIRGFLGRMLSWPVRSKASMCWRGGVAGSAAR